MEGSDNGLYLTIRTRSSSLISTQATDRDCQREEAAASAATRSQAKSVLGPARMTATRANQPTVTIVVDEIQASA